VTNLTDDPQMVAVDVVAAPFGCEAFITSDPVLMVEPRGKAACQVQIELLSTLGVRRLGGPIVIGARTAVVTVDDAAGPLVRDLSVSCEIRAMAKAPKQVFATVDELLQQYLPGIWPS
jgi:hypothetical protein